MRNHEYSNYYNEEINNNYNNFEKVALENQIAALERAAFERAAFNHGVRGYEELFDPNVPSTPDPSRIKPDEPTTGQLLADMYATESGTMECSILASDCMARANEVYDSKAKGSSVTLYSSEQDFAGNKFRGLTQVTEIDNKFGITTNRIIGAGNATFQEWTGTLKFSLGLLKQEGSDGEDQGFGIYAITRQNLAFPIVKFVRSQGSYCDYLQFYGENPEDELQSGNLYGWGQDDNGSRFSAVEGIIELVNSIDSDFEITQDVTSDHFALLRKLGLFKRFEKELGVTNNEKETFIEAMHAIDPNFDLELQKQYEVNIGKVKTNMTVSLEIKPGKDKRFRRVVTKREFPTNMPNEVRELVITVDKRTGILVVDSEGNERSLSETDMKVIEDIILTGNLVNIERNNLKGLKKFFQKRKAKA